MTRPPSDSPPAASVVATSAGLGVRVERVNKTFPDGVTAIDALDLHITAGSFVALLGPSGCGKSTLLRLIANLDTPTAGRITFEDGQAASDDPSPHHPSGDSRRASIAYVFQDAHLLPWRSVWRNVALPLELMKTPAGERKAVAAEALAKVGLAEAMDRYPAQLSGGMRMRVSLARALVTRPRLLLLDEPFAALDEITRQQLDEQLHQLWRDSGVTVLFVTHSTAEATYLAQRAVVFSARPASIVHDDVIALPQDRPRDIRGHATFAQATAILYDALERGEHAR